MSTFLSYFSPFPFYQLFSYTTCLIVFCLFQVKVSTDLPKMQMILPHIIVCCHQLVDETHFSVEYGCLHTIGSSRSSQRSRILSSSPKHNLSSWLQVSDVIKLRFYDFFSRELYSRCIPRAKTKACLWCSLLLSNN